jgi:putative transposase
MLGSSACHEVGKSYTYTRDLVTPTGRIEALKVRRRSGRGVSQPGLRALQSLRTGGGRSADPDVCQWDKHAISVGEVAATLMGVAPSASAVSRLNQTLTEQYATWRERPLLPHYRILYLDGIHFTVRHGTQTDATIIFTALGVDLEGNKDVLARLACAPGATKTDGGASCKTCAAVAPPRWI